MDVPLTVLKFTKKIPGPVLKILNQVYIRALDLADYRERQRDLTPPRTLYFVGDGDFKATGHEFRKLFIEVGGLKPEHHVLDVGCGIGRMAVPLTSYLLPTASYEGFDIVQQGIAWCQTNITPRFPSFRFRHSDVRNNFYNPNGIYEAKGYRFPYEDARFDFIFLTSVFTHVFPPALENYLAEIARVLKPGGRCFITFFLMNDESTALIAEGVASQNFVHELDGCYTTYLPNPEGALAFREPYITGLYEKLGLSIETPIRYGKWCGRGEFLSYQDVIIATKNV